jgi:hypothetical protein
MQYKNIPYYKLPKSIIAYIKSFFSISDNIKIQLINKNWYLTKYTIINVVVNNLQATKMINYIILKTYFHNIEHLDLSNIRNITNHIINGIKNITKLKKLNLHNTNISDEDIKLLIPKGKNIIDLDISNCNKLTDKCMNFITAFTNLQILNLSFSCRITEKGILHLSNYNSLLNLNLSSFCDANNSLIHIGKISNLETLNILNNELNINNIKYLINNKKLHTLYIPCNYEKQIKDIKHFETIDINYEYNFAIHLCCSKYEEMINYIVSNRLGRLEEKNIKC